MTNRDSSLADLAMSAVFGDLPDVADMLKYVQITFKKML